MDEQLKNELTAALATAGASWVNPPRPVALVTDSADRKVTGWLWGRKRTDDGTWLGLATLWFGTLFDGATLGWQPAEDLRTLD